MKRIALAAPFVASTPALAIPVISPDQAAIGARATEDRKGGFQIGARDIEDRKI